MTRAEFMEKLERELRARKVPEPEDILAEYRRHFEYKLADGYSEEETAARLGDPAELAARGRLRALRAHLDGAGVRGHLRIELFYGVCMLGSDRGLHGCGRGAHRLARGAGGLRCGGHGHVHAHSRGP